MKKNQKQIVIFGKRWFSAGSTYHSVEVYLGGVLVERKEYAYGSGGQFMQSGHELLQENGVYPKTGKRLKSGGDKDYCDFLTDVRNGSILCLVADVGRKGDL